MQFWCINHRFVHWENHGSNAIKGNSYWMMTLNNLPIRIPTEKYRNSRFGVKAERNTPRASNRAPSMVTKRYPNLLVNMPATGPEIKNFMVNQMYVLLI